MASKLENIIDPALTDASDIKIAVSKVMDMSIAQADNGLIGKTRSQGAAKSLNEFFSLVRTAIDDYEKRANTLEINKVNFTEEEPDSKSQTETITFSVMRREPGAFAQGAPFEGKVKNLRPVFREQMDDPENPGYRLVTTGYWHDNIVRFTMWARTNKAANARALWFEKFAEEYSWWFKVQGVDRVLFWNREADIAVNQDNNRWYGRPLDFFVRTETLRIISEKTIEDIMISVGTSEL